MKTDVQRLIGRKLREARQRKGWSLAQMQDASGDRWKAVVVGSYERGDRSITVERLVALAEFYGVPPQSLLPGEGTDDEHRAMVYAELAAEFAHRAADKRGDYDEASVL